MKMIKKWLLKWEKHCKLIMCNPYEGFSPLKLITKDLPQMSGFLKIIIIELCIDIYFYSLI